MLKRMMYKKIAIATGILLSILLLYLIPTNKEEINLNKKQTLEYTQPNNLEAIYLLDNNNYLSRTKINIKDENNLTKAEELIELLTINNKKKDIIPEYFKSILPENTKILDINLKDEILTINFSKEFNNIKLEYEEKLIESLIYTLTNINGIEKIKIYVNNEPLTKLPNSKKKLPPLLDKKYGINKQYELTTLNNIDSYTVYYISNYNDEIYYTPVTKYINNKKEDKVKIIIDELSTSLNYQSNLMSYLDSNVKLLNYEIKDNTIKLNFNDLIATDIKEDKILEEVTYTIGLSLCEELDVEKVIFEVEGKEICTFSAKILD